VRLLEDVDEVEGEEAVAEVEDEGDVAAESEEVVVVKGVLAVPRDGVAQCTFGGCSRGRS
jgi:hypothetical protein